MWTNCPLTQIFEKFNNMNNEIGRKLTSLTLMTIMLAGGMTIAAPSMMPQAAAAGALYVSAERNVRQHIRWCSNYRSRCN